jgi:soluble lytic murein transglycosylase-like protein
MRCFRTLPLFAILALTCVGAADARTVYRCWRDGSISLATAPEPGSSCKPEHVDDDAAKLPNLWGVNGAQSGVLYERQQDGVTVYSTRNLPGSTRLFAFTVVPPAGSPAHAGLGTVGEPRVDVHAAIFAKAARANGIEDAWLRAVAHAESGLRDDAVSAKGAQGIMQLMPETTVLYRVHDPFSASDSIRGGAKYLRDLLHRYHGDRRLAAAAYNAGAQAVERYQGIPPYAETREYVDKVETLYARYRQALLASQARPEAAK